MKKLLLLSVLLLSACVQYKDGELVEQSDTESVEEMENETSDKENFEDEK